VYAVNLERHLQHHDFDSSAQPERDIFACPDCLQPMRIRVIEAKAGSERIQFQCAACGVDEMQELELPK